MTEQEIKDKLPSILEIARLAPSVHNAQPWKVKVSDSSVIVSMDPDHALEHSDPTGRETVLSLGIFAEAFKIGCEANSLEVAATKLSGDDLVIDLLGASQTRDVNQRIQLLKTRCTDRSIYEPAAITEQLEEDLRNCTLSGSVQLEVITDSVSIQKIANLTAKGIRLALSNPEFRKELSSYLILPWSKKRRGISVKSLYIPRLLAYLEPLFMRLGLGLGTEVRIENKRWRSASAVIVITGSGDLSEYWFEAGRVYLNASLAIEKAGLSQATSAAIVEASTFHEDIEAMIGTKQRILSIIRVGKGSRKRHHSPRISVQDLLH